MEGVLLLNCPDVIESPSCSVNLWLGLRGAAGELELRWPFPRGGPPRPVLRADLAARPLTVWEAGAVRLDGPRSGPPCFLSCEVGDE